MAKPVPPIRVQVVADDDPTMITVTVAPGRYLEVTIRPAEPSVQHDIQVTVMNKPIVSVPPTPPSGDTSLASSSAPASSSDVR